MLLDHTPVARRKDLGVQEPIGVEPEIARKVSRRQIEILLVSFIVLTAIEGVVVGFLVDHPFLVTAGALVWGVLYFFVAREFGDAWLVRALGAKTEAGPRVKRLATSEARTARIPSPRTLIVPGDVPNALSFALRRRWLVTTQSCESLDELVLEGLLAHEIIHLRDGDAAVASLYAVLAGSPELLFRGAGLAILGLPLWPVAFGLRLARRAVAAPDREHRADVAGAMMTRYPPGIAKALETAGGGSAGMSLLDPYWFVARDGRPEETARRAALVREM
jgi:heat shock protein HtpX